MRIQIFLIILMIQPGLAFIGSSLKNSQHVAIMLSEQRSSASDLQAEAERLLARAREIRSQIPVEESTAAATTAASSSSTIAAKTNPWLCAPVADEVGIDYRLYIDIGREAGTWMDPRWGASGRRIEFTLDVRFVENAAANDSLRQQLGSNNNLKPNRSVQILRSAEFARLRSGFDRMKCYGGAYSLDMATNSSPIAASTMRFMIQVEGTNSYGDVTIPAGCLYFCLPCFANNIALLSTKEGTITIRQMGWNTGWRREESRIVGTFRAVLLDKARQRDGF